MSEIQDTQLQSFCDFLSGSINQMLTLPYANGLFDVEYNISGQTYFRMLIVSLLHEYCVQNTIQPYNDINLGVLLTYALHYDLHNSPMQNFIMDDNFKNLAENTIVTNRLLGLSGLMRDNFKMFWNATKGNPDNPINQLLHLADVLTDFMMALEYSMKGERLPTIHLETLYKRLAFPVMRGNIRQIQIWFVEKFGNLVNTYVETSEELNDKV